MPLKPPAVRLPEVCCPPPCGIPPPEAPETPEEPPRWPEFLLPPPEPFDSVSPTGMRTVFVSPVSVISEDEDDAPEEASAGAAEEDAPPLPPRLRFPTASVIWLPTTAVTLPTSRARPEEPPPEDAAESARPPVPPLCEQATAGTARIRKAIRAAQALLLHLIKNFPPIPR